MYQMDRQMQGRKMRQPTAAPDWVAGSVHGVTEDGSLEQRTHAYKAWVRRVTEEHDIPAVAAPRGVKKEELVEPYYRRLKGDQGVACVLTSMEQGRTFVSYMPRWKVPSGDANYRFIKACRNLECPGRRRARDGGDRALRADQKQRNRGRHADVRWSVHEVDDREGCPLSRGRYGMLRRIR